MNSTSSRTEPVKSPTETVLARTSDPYRAGVGRACGEWAGRVVSGACGTVQAMTRNPELMIKTPKHLHCKGFLHRPPNAPARLRRACAEALPPPPSRAPRPIRARAARGSWLCPPALHSCDLDELCSARGAGLYGDRCLGAAKATCNEADQLCVRLPVNRSRLNMRHPYAAASADQLADPRSRLHPDFDQERLCATRQGNVTTALLTGKSRR